MSVSVCVCDECREYILDLLEGDRKLLVFAHHKDLLDSLEEAVRKVQSRGLSPLMVERICQGSTLRTVL